MHYEPDIFVIQIIIMEIIMVLEIGLLLFYTIFCVSFNVNHVSLSDIILKITELNDTFCGKKKKKQQHALHPFNKFLHSTV